jgi:hypothetical protein
MGLSIAMLPRLLREWLTLSETVELALVVDSLDSAARYLRALGADADPASQNSRRALERYGTDVERVLALVGGPFRATATGPDVGGPARRR